jgi:hypothetical protein
MGRLALVLSSLFLYLEIPMGNVIIMAVRHQDLDAVAALDFNAIGGSACHRSDTLPKSFDGQPLWIRPKDVPYEICTPNVVFSQYHHTSGTCSFYIDDQMLVSASTLGWTARLKDAGPAFDFNSKVTELRRYLRGYKTKLLKSKDSRELRMPGSHVSLFRIFTDTMDRVEKNPNVMQDVAQYCRSGEANPRTFGSLNAGIEAIGTLDGEHAHLFVSAGYEGKAFTLPRHELVFSDEERVRILAQPLGYNNAQSFEMALLRELAAGFGYQLVPLGSAVKK